MAKRAFSLLELTIVLVLISLLTSAVITGQRIVANSKITNLAAQYNDLKTAYANFVSTYDAYPGDFSNATRTIGSSVSDGDGDTKIEIGGGIVEDAIAHLSAARFIAPGLATYMPLQNWKDGYAKIYYKLLNDNSTISGTTYLDTKSNFVQIGHDTATEEALLIPREAFQFDNKMDDGKPQSGNVVYKIYSTTTPVVSDATCVSSSIAYKLDSSTVGCNLAIKIDMMI